MSLLEWCRNWKAHMAEEELQEADGGDDKTVETVSIESDGIQVVEEKRTIIHPKAVLVDGEEYSSIKSAAEAVGCSASALSNHLRDGDSEYRGHAISYA